jgi:signal transduction histidine kinase
MKNKKLFLKFIFASFVISALAVTLGFFGTHMILSSQEKRYENRFVPEAVHTIELLAKKTNMPIEEIVAEYNSGPNEREGDDGPPPGEFDGPGMRPPGGPGGGFHDGPPPGRSGFGGPRMDGARRPPVVVSVITKNEAAFTLPKDIGEYVEIPSKFSDFKMFKDQVYRYDEEHYLVFRFNPPGEGAQAQKGGRFEKRSGPLPMFIVPLILTFVIILFVLTAAALLVLYFLRRQAQKAGEVLRALKLGDLKARFPITKIDEASELMLEFNEMAGEIEKLVVDLRDVDSLRRKLLQELAHDLRTPVASMKSMLESLLYQGERMNKEMREESLQMSLKEVDYFHHLVEDLLFLSGVHDIKYRGKFSTVDVCDIIQHEVQVISEMNKKINVSFVHDDFYFVRADQHLFQRLMKNALSNAADNAESLVYVNIVKNEENKTITIEIINDGNGLTQEEIESFGKKRATRRINENTEGKISVGLGAVIMNRICEIHSANFKIENVSEFGKTGAKLSLTFEYIII